MNNLVSITVLLTVCCSASFAAAETASTMSGLFGYRFGEVISSDSEGITECSDNNITCWGVNRDLAPVMYNVQISINKDKEVFGLTATESFEADELSHCMSAANRLANTFVRVHKVQFNKTASQKPQEFKVSWVGVTVAKPIINVSVSCKENTIYGQAKTNYILEVSSWNSD